MLRPQCLGSAITEFSSLAEAPCEKHGLGACKVQVLESPLVIVRRAKHLHDAPKFLALPNPLMMRASQIGETIPPDGMNGQRLRQCYQYPGGQVVGANRKHRRLTQVPASCAVVLDRCRFNLDGTLPLTASCCWFIAEYASRKGSQTFHLCRNQRADCGRLAIGAVRGGTTRTVYKRSVRPDFYLHCAHNRPLFNPHSFGLLVHSFRACFSRRRSRWSGLSFPPSLSCCLLLCCFSAFRCLSTTLRRPPRFQ